MCVCSHVHIALHSAKGPAALPSYHPTQIGLHEATQLSIVQEAELAALVPLVRTLGKAVRPRERDEEEADPAGGRSRGRPRRLAGPWETHGRQRWLTTIEPEESPACGGLEAQASDSAASEAEIAAASAATRAEAEAEHGRAAVRQRLMTSLALGQSFLRMLASQRDLGPQLEAVLAACNGVASAAAAFAPHVAALRSGGRIDDAAAPTAGGGEDVASQGAFEAVWAQGQLLAQRCHGLLQRVQEACSTTTAHLDEHCGGGKGAGGGGGGGGDEVKSRLPEIQSRQELLGAARGALDAANEAIAVLRGDTKFGGRVVVAAAAAVEETGDATLPPPTPLVAAVAERWPSVLAEWDGPLQRAQRAVAAAVRAQDAPFTSVAFPHITCVLLLSLLLTVRYAIMRSSARWVRWVGLCSSWDVRCSTRRRARRRWLPIHRPYTAGGARLGYLVITPCTIQAMATFVGLAERGNCQWDTFAEDASGGGVGGGGVGGGGVGGGGVGGGGVGGGGGGGGDMTELRAALEALGGAPTC